MTEWWWSRPLNIKNFSSYFHHLHFYGIWLVCCFVAFLRFSFVIYHISSHINTIKKMVHFGFGMAFFCYGASSNRFSHKYWCLSVVKVAVAWFHWVCLHVMGWDTDMYTLFFPILQTDTSNLARMMKMEHMSTFYTFVSLLLSSRYFICYDWSVHTVATTKFACWRSKFHRIRNSNLFSCGFFLFCFLFHMCTYPWVRQPFHATQISITSKLTHCLFQAFYFKTYLMTRKYACTLLPFICYVI